MAIRKREGSGVRNEAPRDFLSEEGGQDIIEYGLLAAFIAIVVLGILFLFSDPLNTIYEVVLNGIRLATK